jgi:hypothetical protein
MTSSKDDWRFDAAKTFSRIEEELECDPTDELEWQFVFSHQDSERLELVGEDIANAFATKMDVEFDSIVCEFDDQPTVEDANGNEIEGRPELALVYMGSLTKEQLSSSHEFLRALAEQNKITYEGVRYC